MESFISFFKSRVVLSTHIVIANIVDYLLRYFVRKLNLIILDNFNLVIEKELAINFEVSSMNK